MMNKYMLGVLITVVSLVLASPSKAQGSAAVGAAAGVVVIAAVAVVAAVVVTVVVIHKSKNSKITGCTSSGGGGMILTNEKDKRVYMLSGNTADIKPGDRMTLQGKKLKASGSNTLTWETKKTTKDFGVCQP
jgi:hypothetical protein